MLQRLIHIQLNSIINFLFSLKKRAQRIIADWINGNCFVVASCDENWVMLWSTPKWGWGKNATSNYLWHPLFIDDDAIVSHIDSNINFTNIESLIGHRLGGLSGHYYQGIDELVAEGKIVREDTHDEETLILRVLKKRVDSIIMQRSALNYYLLGRYALQKDKLMISEQPYQKFTASSMFAPKRHDLKEAFIQLTESAQWQELLSQYAITAIQ